MMLADSAESNGSTIRKYRAWLWERLQFSESGAMMVIAVVVGLLGGLGAVGFHELVHWTTEVVEHWKAYSEQRHLGWLLIILGPSLGAGLAGLIVWRFARQDHSHGTSAVMEAVALRGGRLPAKPILAKVLGAGMVIGSGGSAGPEDPSVQVGSVIGSWIGTRLKLSDTRVEGLVAAGVASAIAAAFNAPIAGAFFALEVVASQFTTQLIGPVILASVAGSIVGRACLGAQPAFEVPPYELLNPLIELPLYGVLGVLAAIVGSMLIVSVFATEKVFASVRLPKPVLAMIGGGLVGLITVAVPGVHGVGYDVAGQILKGTIEAAGLLLVAKFIATSITIGSASGGTFAPSLVIGAALGALYGQVVNHFLPGSTAPAAAYALVGMGAVLAAVVRAPITAVLLLFEVTGDYHIILPIMASVVVSTLFASRLHTESIYTERLVRKGIQLCFGRDVNILEVVRVDEVMTRDPESVPPDLPLGSLAQLFQETHHHGLPVVNNQDTLVGIVTLSDLSRATASGVPDNAPISAIATRELVHVFPDQTLNAALRLLATAEVGRLPVVDRQHPERLLGMLRRSDLIKAYKQMSMRHQELDYRLQQMRASSHSGGHLVSFEIPPDGPLDGRMIRELRLPHAAIISGIRRGAESIVPRGHVILNAGDLLTVLTSGEHVAEVETALREGGAASSDLHFREVHIASGNALIDIPVKDMKLPAGVMFVLLRRDGVTHTVNGRSVLKEGDEITLVSPSASLKSADKLFGSTPIWGSATG